MKRRSVMASMLVVVVVVALALIGIVVRQNRGGSAAPVAPLGAGDEVEVDSPAVARFFDEYVDPDGRVVRHDEGGDTVSEGQAYALLLATATGDRERFDRVWGWTKENLQRADGLLSWKWAGGRVIDPEPATDADLDAARALVMAGRRFDDPALTEDGNRLASAVLDRETAEISGELVLLAGPWAARDRVVNPSYVSPCTYSLLGEATGDGRWRRLAENGTRLVETALRDDRLPPDWARLDDEGNLTPTGPPSAPERRPQYGLDAARLGFRLAEDCDGPGPALAARLWHRLERVDGRGAALSYSLDGERLTPDEHPVGLVGAAAAARAAGDTEASNRLLEGAASLAERHPTYYGTAWWALGEALLRPSSGSEAAQPEEDAP